MKQVAHNVELDIIRRLDKHLVHLVELVNTLQVEVQQVVLRVQIYQKMLK